MAGLGNRRAQGRPGRVPVALPRFYRRLYAPLPHDEPRGDGDDADGRGLQAVSFWGITGIWRMVADPGRAGLPLSARMAYYAATQNSPKRPHDPSRQRQQASRPPDPFH